jgi:hypothetical protein
MVHLSILGSVNHNYWAEHHHLLQLSTLHEYILRYDPSALLLLLLLRTVGMNERGENRTYSQYLQ